MVYHTSPAIKFEASPDESFSHSPIVKFEPLHDEAFLSTPGDSYSPLFSASTPSSTTTMNPMEMMTPQSVVDGKPDSSRLSTISEQSEDSTSTDAAPASTEKKPVKKRKSWGQVLPEPKTNLPPRKRAKTEDEKEQRRVERVLRNRRAAQSSRERKRLEVEALEKRNKELEQLLINAQKTNLMLVEELNRFRRSSGVVTRSSSPLDSLRESITLSHQLFTQQGQKSSDQSLVDELMRSAVNPTVNPASLSPSLTPVPDVDESHEHYHEDEEEEEEEEDDDDDEVEEEEAEEEAVAAATVAQEVRASEQTPAILPDSTQRPAEMLCDLQCQSAEMPKSFLVSQTSVAPLLTWYLQLRMMLLSASAVLSACRRPLTQIAMSSKAGFSLLPTPQLLTTIIWLVTLPPASRINPTSTSSTSMTSSPTTQTTSRMTLWQRATLPLRTTDSTSRSTTLRLKSLRNILTSSPSLARPLMDATLVALRLVSERCDDRVETSERRSAANRGDVDELTRSLSSVVLPSREVLITLLWALKVEDRRILRKQGGALLDPERRTPSTNHLIPSRGAGVKKRTKSQRLGDGSERCRLSRR